MPDQPKRYGNRGLGRPSKLTPETQAKFLSAIAAGAFPEVAATYAGIDRVTYFRWMERGAQERSGPYVDFRNMVMQAEAEVELLAGGTLRTAALDDSKAAVTFLKLRFGRRWREHTVQEVTGAEGGPIAHEIAGALASLTDADLERLARQLRAAAGGDRSGAETPSDD